MFSLLSHFCTAANVFRESSSSPSPLAILTSNTPSPVYVKQEEESNPPAPNTHGLQLADTLRIRVGKCRPLDGRVACSLQARGPTAQHCGHLRRRAVHDRRARDRVQREHRKQEHVPNAPRPSLVDPPLSRRVSPRTISARAAARDPPHPRAACSRPRRTPRWA